MSYIIAHIGCWGGSAQSSTDGQGDTSYPNLNGLSNGGLSYPIGGTQNSGGSGGIITVISRVANDSPIDHLSGTSGGLGYGGFGLNYCDTYTEHLYEKDTELIGVMNNNIISYIDHNRVDSKPYGGGGGGGGGFYGGGGGAGTGGAGGSSYCDPFLCSNIEYSSSTIPADGHITITYAVEAANNPLSVTLPPSHLPTSVTVPPSTLPGGVIMTNTESISVSFSVRVAFFAVLILLLLFIAYRVRQNNNSSMSDPSQSVITSTMSHSKPIYNPLNPHNDYEQLSTSN